MQIVRKAVKLRKAARYMVENCGLVSWLSSVVLSISDRLSGEGNGFCFSLLVASLEVIVCRNIFAHYMVSSIPLEGFTIL